MGEIGSFFKITFLNFWGMKVNPTLPLLVQLVLPHLLLSIDQLRLYLARAESSLPIVEFALYISVFLFLASHVCGCKTAGNNRVLFFAANQGSATGIYGQTDFSKNAVRQIGPFSLHAPSGLAYDGGSLFICDTGNRRVVRYSAASSVNGVWGNPNADMIVAETSQSMMRGPSSIALSGTRMFVGDKEDSRVLEFQLNAIEAPCSCQSPLRSSW